LARRGGDEFVVLLTKVGSAVDAENVAEKICAELALPFVLQEHTVLISGSLGVAVYPDNGTDSEQLIHDADQCMYRAKQEGRNRWVSVRKAGTTT
jgi:diguanylate cyclase (GGDEF)-like protein